MTLDAQSHLRTSKSIVTPRNEERRDVEVLGIVEVIGEDDFKSAKSDELPAAKTKLTKRAIQKKTLLEQCQELCNSNSPTLLADYDRVFNRVATRLQ